jgi:hypothetical protein
MERGHALSWKLQIGEGLEIPDSIRIFKFLKFIVEMTSLVVG